MLLPDPPTPILYRHLSEHKSLVSQPGLTVQEESSLAPWARRVRGKEMVRMADETRKRN